LLTCITAAGVFCTFMDPETNGSSLEDLSGENDAEQQRAPYNEAYLDKTAPSEY